MSALANTSVAPEFAKRLECGRFIAAFDARLCVTVTHGVRPLPPDDLSDAFQINQHPLRVAEVKNLPKILGRPEVSRLAERVLRAVVQPHRERPERLLFSHLFDRRCIQQSILTPRRTCGNGKFRERMDLKGNPRNRNPKSR